MFKEAEAAKKADEKIKKEDARRAKAAAKKQQAQEGGGLIRSSTRPLELKHIQSIIHTQSTRTPHASGGKASCGGGKDGKDGAG